MAETKIERLKRKFEEANHRRVNLADSVIQDIIDGNSQATDDELVEDMWDYEP